MLSWQADTIAKFDDVVALQRGQSSFDEYIAEVNMRMNEIVGILGEHIDLNEEYSDDFIDVDSDLWLSMPPTKESIPAYLEIHPMLGLTAFLRSAISFYKLPLNTTLMPNWGEEHRQANLRLWRSERALGHSREVYQAAVLAGESAKLWYTKNKKKLPWVKVGDK